MARRDRRTRGFFGTSTTGSCEATTSARPTKGCGDPRLAKGSRAHDATGVKKASLLALSAAGYEPPTWLDQVAGHAPRPPTVSDSSSQDSFGKELEDLLDFSSYEASSQAERQDSAQALPQHPGSPRTSIDRSHTGSSANSGTDPSCLSPHRHASSPASPPPYSPDMFDLPEIVQL